MSRPSLVPVIVLFVVLVVLAVVGYIVYSIIQDVTKNTREKLEDRNVVFSKDGMKVGVKEIKDEEYRDRSQRFVFSCPFFCTHVIIWCARLTLAVSS